MNKNNCCLLNRMKEHYCRECEYCYCNVVDEHGQVPTDAEIEAEIDFERLMAEANAMADEL